MAPPENLWVNFPGFPRDQSPGPPGILRMVLKASVADQGSFSPNSKQFGRLNGDEVIRTDLLIRAIREIRG